MTYFYEVAPRFATAERPRFDASAGYLGSFLRAVLDHPLVPRLRLGLDLRLGLHTGATNDESSLSRDEVTHRHERRLNALGERGAPPVIASPLNQDQPESEERQMRCPVRLRHRDARRQQRGRREAACVVGRESASCPVWNEPPSPEHR